MSRRIQKNGWGLENPERANPETKETALKSSVNFVKRGAGDKAGDT